jgi:hypothetical protein
MPASSAVPLNDAEALEFDQLTRSAGPGMHACVTGVNRKWACWRRSFGVTAASRIGHAAVVHGPGPAFWARIAAGGGAAPVIAGASGNATPIPLIPQPPAADPGARDMSQVPIRESVTQGPADAGGDLRVFGLSMSVLPPVLQTTNPQIFEKYVAPGKVRFVYKHYAILGRSLSGRRRPPSARPIRGVSGISRRVVQARGRGRRRERGAFNKDKLLQYAEGLKLIWALHAMSSNDETLRAFRPIHRKGAVLA